MGSKCWKVVLIGWELSSAKDTTSKDVLKPKITWTKEEDETSLGNSCALNALFNRVSQNVFKINNTYTSAKEAWNILEVAYEGTSKIKVSKLQILTLRFEALKMAKEETIEEFNVRVLDLANEPFTLREKISDSKMV
ncbi:gag-pol polyprotein [Cucumis melo var. makuwa]|uniref:Gag-pol polyprotein n=1 Tax=Cucumis melo var. makuwa TaxID=1194695 RepID=A0A5D3E2Q7_CUCMM|nr:gag-pol polyprotein [Cucumis melo var. makuwa]